jgi:predicted Zn-dependent peptidase
VDHDELAGLLEPSFGPLQTGDGAGERRPPQPSPGLSLHHRELEQVHLCLGGAFPGVRDERRYPAALLNIILGGNMSSRLFQEIRENRGLAYSVYSFFSAYLDAGMLGVYAGVDPGKTEETARLIAAELDKLRDGGLDDEELGAAREHLKGSIILGSESVDNRMTRLAKNEITYGRRIEFDEIIEKVEQVTVDQVVNVARDYLRPEQLSVTVLGPAREENIPRELLKAD